MKYKIPVEWTVCDTVEVEANSFKEAIQYVINNKDDIPLGTEPNYIDGTYKINGEDDIYSIESDEDYIEELTNVLESYGYGEGYEEYDRE